MKDPKDFTLIGTKLHRLDHVAKTNGSAIFALDVRRPGMLTAVLQRSPRFGGTVKSVDDAAARAMKGVVDVVHGPAGRGGAGREHLGGASRPGRPQDRVGRQQGRDALQRRHAGRLQGARGDAGRASRSRPATPDQALTSAGKVVKAEFVFPYLAHAPMEPLNGTIEQAADGSYDIYAGSQFPTIEQAVAAATLGRHARQGAASTPFGRAARSAGARRRTATISASSRPS